jgi:hypothetical protein
MSKESVKSNASPEAARVRLTLDLSQRLNEIVDRIAAENESSKADVLRFAIEFLSAATDAKKAGMHVGAWKERRKSPGTRVRRHLTSIFDTTTRSFVSGHPSKGGGLIFQRRQ